MANLATFVPNTLFHIMSSLFLSRGQKAGAIEVFRGNGNGDLSSLTEYKGGGKGEHEKLTAREGRGDRQNAISRKI